MTERERSTGEQPIVTPSVTTAPARDGWRLSRIPSHLGRARTSTVVLGALFLAIGTLYLNIRPETPAPAATTSGTGTVQTVPTTTAPATTTSAVPTSTTSAPETTSAPTTDAEPTDTATDEPTETTAPEETTPPTSSLPTRVPTSAPSSPTAVSPTG